MENQRKLYRDIVRSQGQESRLSRVGFTGRGRVKAEKLRLGIILLHAGKKKKEPSDGDEKRASK